MGKEQKSEQDDAVGPPTEPAAEEPDAAPSEGDAAPIEGMESVAMSMGPRGEIILDSDGTARGGRTKEKSAIRAERDRTAGPGPARRPATEPDTPDNHPSIAVNEEPSG